MGKTGKILLVLLVLGLADAIYLAAVQLGSIPLYCTTSDFINCQTVETSIYSKVFGVPITYGGVAWFVVAMLLFFAARSKRIKMIAPLWYVLGMGAAAYSLLSMYALARICEYCILLDTVLIAIGILAIKINK